MTKLNYLKLKKRLKKISNNIKTNRSELKEAQRSLSVPNPTTDDASINLGYNLCRKKNKCINNNFKLKHEFRHNHIVISMARGKTYEQIENKVREGNEPSWSFIKTLKDLYGFDEVEESLVKEMVAI